MRKVGLWWMWPLPLTTRSDFWVGRVGGGPLQVECRLSVFVLTTRQICEGQWCFTPKNTLMSLRNTFVWAGFFPIDSRKSSIRFGTSLATCVDRSISIWRAFGAMLREEKGSFSLFLLLKMVTNGSIQRFWVETMWWEFGCQGYEEIQVCWAVQSLNTFPKRTLTRFHDSTDSGVKHD